MIDVYHIHLRQMLICVSALCVGGKVSPLYNLAVDEQDRFITVDVPNNCVSYDYNIYDMSGSM